MLSRHWAIPVLTFAAVTAWWLFPVLSNPSTIVLGGGAGDNVTFIWNVWWMRYVLHHSGQSFFFTPFLFHPAGVDLTLHTNTALPALLGAAWSSPIAGQNAVIALHIYFNFLCSYALAHRVTRQTVPSLAAAAIFGTSAFVTAHLNGHFNLIAAWTMPLVSLLTLNAIERPSSVRGVLVGLALAATAYTDYYLLVYAAIIMILSWLSQIVRLDLNTQRDAPQAKSIFRSRLLAGLSALLVLDALVIAVILVFPGDRFAVGPLHISVRSVRNPITVAWLLLLVGAAIAASARMRLTMIPGGARRSRHAFIAAAGTTTILLLPLLFHAAALWRTGSYVSQTYLWRSGPSGIDLATFILGHPFHAIWGDSVRALYDRFHVDAIEASGWIPLSAIALAMATITRRDGKHDTVPWVLTGAVFMVWALGPWLTVFGRQTPVILPAIFLRFVPIVSNARIPGRAMVVVYLVIAVLAAIGLERLAAGSRKARAVGWCLFAMLLIECIAARPPLYTPNRPSTYLALHDAAKAGAVCELPLGLRDGFGEIGSLDEAVLLHQTVHERHLVGGFVARLAPSIIRTYQAMPVIRSFLRLSSGGQPSDEDLLLTRDEAAARLATAGIAYVVLDLRRAQPDLVRYVQSQIDLRHMADEDGRVFYEVPLAPAAH